MRINLETVSNVLIVLSFPLLLSIGYSHLQGPKATPPVAVAKPGDTIAVPKLARTDCKLKLLFFLSGHCKFCQAESEFYRTLTQEFHKQACSVGLFPPADSGRTEFLNRNQLHFDTLATFSVPEFAIRGTPTVMIVGADNRLISAKIGALKPDGQIALVKEIHSRLADR